MAVRQGVQGEELEQAKAWFAARDHGRLARWEQQHNYAVTVTCILGDERGFVKAWRSELGRADHDRAQGHDEQASAAAERGTNPDERALAAAAAEQCATAAGRARGRAHAL